MREKSTLATEEIGKAYGGRRVVHSVSLNIHQGEVVGLLGPNGAGKTTIFYMIVGLTPLDEGRVLLNGEDITDVPMYLRARVHRISYLPQEPSVFRKLTVEENILAVLEAQPISWHERRERVERLTEQLGLGHIRRNRGYPINDRSDPFVLNGARTAARWLVCPVFCCPQDIGTPPVARPLGLPSTVIM